MKKLGYLAGASLLFVPMPLYAAGIGSSNQVFTHTGCCLLYTSDAADE